MRIVVRPLIDSLTALPVNGTMPLAYGLVELLTVDTPFWEEAEDEVEEFEDELPDDPDEPEEIAEGSYAVTAGFA